MTTNSSEWALDPANWQALCDALEPATAVDRPYDHIRIDENENGDLQGYVSEPYPETNVPDTENGDFSVPDDWDWGPENKRTTLPEEVANVVWNQITALRDTALTINDDAPNLTVSLKTSVFTPTEAVAVLSIKRELDVDELGLHTQFKELMSTLGHTETPDTATWGNHLAPMTDDLSDHEFDLGMGATAYRRVENPHDYWKNCDTLEDYIDMCVDNGMDRSEMEAREEYQHHFHPDTRIVDLSVEQEQAVIDWRLALVESIRPHLTLGDAVLTDYLSDVWFTESGSGAVVYSVTVGDDIHDEYTD